MEDTQLRELIAEAEKDQQREADTPSSVSVLDEKQIKLLEQINAQNDFLKKENQILDIYMKRVKKSKGKKLADQSFLLTPEEKFDITQMELEIIQQDLDKVKKDGEYSIENLTAKQEEIQDYMQDIKRQTFEFKRDIIMGAENQRTGKIVAEKLLRYLEEHMKSRVAKLEKLRLKNPQLKRQAQKFKKSIAQREEMGDIFSAIDYEQLKIENSQYLERIEEKNQELLRLKYTTGKTLTTLNSLKNELQDHSTVIKDLKKQIDEKENNLANFQDNLAQATKDRNVCKQQYLQLKADQENVEQPRTLEYVKLNQEIIDLQQKIKDYQRKLEIMDLSINNSTMRQTNLQHMSPQHQQVNNELQQK